MEPWSHEIDERCFPEELLEFYREHGRGIAVFTAVLHFPVCLHRANLSITAYKLGCHRQPFPLPPSRRVFQILVLILQVWARNRQQPKDFCQEGQPVSPKVLNNFLDALPVVCSPLNEAALFKVSFSLAFFAELLMSFLYAPVMIFLGGPCS